MKSDESSTVLRMDRYEYGVVIKGLVNLRNSLVHENKPHDFVDEVLLKTLDAPEKKTKTFEVER